MADLPVTRLATGDSFAGYDLVRPIGQGALGSVWLANDPAGHPVALKVISLADDTDGALRLSFEREVRSSRRLSHPCIVPLRDAGQVGAHAYLAMDYVRGGDLDQYRGNRRLTPPADALRVGLCVARALQHAHAQGVVHRDIKPSNILFDAAANAFKLADFGLARLADLQRSRTGVLAGTPAYMSPEQLADSQQDGRSDLYSLGVVLFELLGGRLPYEASSLGVLLRQVSGTEAPPVEVLPATTPERFRTLVRRLLERDRDRRPETADRVVEALSAMLDEPRPGA